jgi:hypothetical protein
LPQFTHFTTVSVEVILSNFFEPQLGHIGQALIFSTIKYLSGARDIIYAILKPIGKNTIKENPL